MKNALKILTTFVLVASFTAACLMLPPILKKTGEETGSNPVYELRSTFRKSCAVVKAKCVDTYALEDGSFFSTLSVEEVLAGERTLKAGRIITVAGKNEPDNEMIVYLNKEKSNSIFSESNCYFAVDDAVYLLKGENIELPHGKTVSIDDIKSDIVKLETQLMTPAKFLFYDDMRSVVEASHSIFIGRVISVSLEEEVDLFTELRGEELHRKGRVFDIKVQINEGIIWRNKKEEIITIKHIGDAYDNTYSQRTGEHIYYNAKMTLPREGDECMFFVTKSPDKKTDYFFLLNSYQGIINVSHKTVYPSAVNIPYAEYTELDEMVRAMFEAVGFSVNSFFIDK